MSKRSPSGKRRSSRLADAHHNVTLSPAAPQLDVGLRELVEQLPPRERTLVVLHYGYGYTLGEIADLLGLSHGNARSVLFRARAKLGEQLREADR